METKFTEGNWIVGVNHEITDSSPANNCIATVEIWDQCPWVSNANLRLIAAAPDMYKAIEYIEELISVCSNEIELADRVTSLSHELSELLKKARGE